MSSTPTNASGRRNIISVLLLLGLVQHLNLHRPRPFLEFPLEPNAAAHLEIGENLQHFLVESAALVRVPTTPVRRVAPGLLLAVGLDLDPVLVLRRDLAGDGARLLLRLLLLVIRRGDGDAEHSDGKRRENRSHLEAPVRRATAYVSS